MERKSSVLRQMMLDGMIGGMMIVCHLSTIQKLTFPETDQCIVLCPDSRCFAIFPPSLSWRKLSMSLLNSYS